MDGTPVEFDIHNNPTHNYLKQACTNVVRGMDRGKSELEILQKGVD